MRWWWRGCGRWHCCQGAVDCWTERRPTRARQVVHGQRLPQGRLAQSAHHGAGQCIRTRRRRQSARRVDPQTGPRTLLPSEGGYQNNAACVGGGTLSYGAMAWRYMPRIFACVQFMEHRLEARLKIGPLLTTTWSPGTKKPNMRSAFPATTRAVVLWPAETPSAHAATRSQSRVPNPRASGQAPWPSSLSHPDGA